MTDVNADTQASPASSRPSAGANGANRASKAGRDGQDGRTAVADRKAALADAAKRWPLSRITGVALLILLLFSVAAMVAPFVWLDRHVAAVRRHGYLLATVAVKEPEI